MRSSSRCTLLPWWTIAAFAVALVVGYFSLRRLSTEALPAAVLAAVVLAAIPLLGYLAVVGGAGRRVAVEPARGFAPRGSENPRQGLS